MTLIRSSLIIAFLSTRLFAVPISGLPSLLPGSVGTSDSLPLYHVLDNTTYQTALSGIATIPGTLSAFSSGGSLPITSSDTILTAFEKINANISGGGITQLTGDCTAGPGSGSKAITCTQAGGGTGVFTVGTLNSSSLTASLPVVTDGSKNLISGAITGTGNFVLAASPTISGTLSTTTVNSSSLTASQAVFSNSSKNLVSNAITGTGSVVMSASPSLSGSVNLSSLTASQAVFSDGSKNLVSNSITGTGNVVMSASPVHTGAVYFSDGSNDYNLAPGWPGSPVTCTTTGAVNFNTQAFATVQVTLTSSDACVLTVSNVVAGGAYVIKVLNATSATLAIAKCDWGTAGAPTLSGNGVYDDIHILVQQSTSSNYHCYVAQGFSE